MCVCAPHYPREGVLHTPLRREAGGSTPGAWRDILMRQAGLGKVCTGKVCPHRKSEPNSKDTSYPTSLIMIMIYNGKK